MIPMFIEPLREFQPQISLVAGCFFIFLSVVLLSLWAGEKGIVAKEHRGDGVGLFVLGVVFLIFGLYVIIPLTVWFIGQTAIEIFKSLKEDWS